MADEKTVKSRIYIRHDTEESWIEADPILAEGEFGYSIAAGENDSGEEVTTYVLKIGDGTSKWSELKDTHIYYNKEDIDNLLAEIETGESNIASRVTTLETTVGTKGGDNGTSTGLIADIEKLQDEVEDESSGLLTVVGDKDKGLVKDVSTLQEEVENETSGLLVIVGKEASGAEEATGLIKDIRALEDTVYTNEDKTGLQDLISANADSIKELDEQINGSEDEEYKDGLLSRVSKLEETVDGNGDTDEGLSARVEAIETTLNGDESAENAGLINEVSIIESDLEALTTFVGTKSDSTTDPETEATGLVKEIEDNATAINTINVVLENKMTTDDVDALFV